MLATLNRPGSLLSVTCMAALTFVAVSCAKHPYRLPPNTCFENKHCRPGQECINQHCFDTGFGIKSGKEEFVEVYGAGCLAQVEGKILVQNFCATGVTEHLAQAVTDQFLMALSDAAPGKVLSIRDIEVMLVQSKGEPSLGRTDEEHIAGIGRAANASAVIYGTVSRIGSSYLLTVSVLDIENQHLVCREGLNVSGDAERLLDLATKVAKMILHQHGVS